MRREQNNALLDELDLDTITNTHFPRVIVYLLNAFFGVLNVWLLLFGQEIDWNWLSWVLAVIFYSLAILLFSTSIYLVIIWSTRLLHFLLKTIGWKIFVPLQLFSKFCKDVFSQTLSIAWLTLVLHTLTFISILYILLNEISLPLPSFVI